jgi:acyl-coenzyme A synthetase/AMP-(fatty) acid ligase
MRQIVTFGAMQTTPNVSTLLDANLEAGRGSKKALITADNAAWTYRDLHQAACRVAVYLRELGVRRGERILLVLDDTPMFRLPSLGPSESARCRFR